MNNVIILDTRLKSQASPTHKSQTGMNPSTARGVSISLSLSLSLSLALILDAVNGGLLCLAHHLGIYVNTAKKLVPSNKFNVPNLWHKTYL